MLEVRLVPSQFHVVDRGCIRPQITFGSHTFPLSAFGIGKFFFGAPRRSFEPNGFWGWLGSNHLLLPPPLSKPPDDVIT